ncbi:MAG: hypothetical protein HKN54_01580 [Flavobacteriaceae bacterium]|nr:hypothetical protein [Flavobacteriaceae bacterium]
MSIVQSNNLTKGNYRRPTAGEFSYCRVIIFIGCLLIVSCRPTKNYLEKDFPVHQSLTKYTPLNHPDSLLSIVSFNIEYGENIDKALEEIHGLPIKDLDVLLLQEMDEKGTAQIADELKFNYIFFPISFHRKYKRNFGNAVLSKWPLSQPRKSILPHDRPFNKMKRGATNAVINYGDIKILIYSVHLEIPLMSLSKRIEQLNYILNDINKNDTLNHIILGGDFNSMFKNEVREVVTHCENQHFTWHTKGIGYTSNKFNVLRPTLDHIFSRGFRHVDSGKLEEYAASRDALQCVSAAAMRLCGNASLRQCVSTLVRFYNLYFFQIF